MALEQNVITRPAELWSVASVKAALHEHEQGIFQNSSLLADAIRRDDRVNASLRTLVLGMLGLPFSMKASVDGDQRRAQTVADDAAKWWPRKFRKHTLMRLAAGRLLMGFQPGELLTTEVDGKWIPKPKLWHAQFVRWVENDRAYTINTKDKGTIPFTPGDGTWFMFGRHDERPWLDGLIRSLAIPWLIRTFCRFDWSRRAEVFGMGIRKAKVPAKTKPEIARKFFRDVKNLGRETTIKLPEGFDLEMLTDAGQGKGEIFSGLIDHCDTAITLSLLGQNLTTQNEGGTYNLGQVHARVQLDHLEALEEDLGDWAEDEVMGPMAARNYGAADLACRPFYDTTPPEDVQKKATAFSVAATASRTMVDGKLATTNEARRIFVHVTGFKLDELDDGNESPAAKPEPANHTPPTAPNAPPAPAQDREPVTPPTN